LVVTSAWVAAAVTAVGSLDVVSSVDAAAGVSAALAAGAPPAGTAASSNANISDTVLASRNAALLGESSRAIAIQLAYLIIFCELF